MPETDILKDTLKQIDEYIVTQQQAIRRGEMLDALMKDPNFKELILDGYIGDEAKRLFTILTDPTGASKMEVEELYGQLQAINNLKGYVGTKDHPGTVKMLANQAILNIEREEQERARVTAVYGEKG